MATRANPYAMDPYLQQGISNLTRALIGSAQDDASLAAAKASEARAGYFDAQTEGQNQKNVSDQQLFESGAALAKLPAFQNALVNAMGLGGNIIREDFMGPPAANQERVSNEGLANLARTFLGNYGNADQMTKALNNIGGAQSSRLAESMILGGDNSQAQRGALMLSPGGGKYQNPGFAQTELTTTDARAGSQDQLQYGVGGQGDRDTEARYGEGGQGDRDNIRDNATSVSNNQRDNQTKITMNTDDNTAQTKWEEYKADRQLEGKKYDVDSRDRTSVTNNNREIEFKKWKHNNRDIEITVEPGKKVVLSPEAGKILKLQPNEDGLYVLDGGPKPGQVVVKVGKEDVYMDEATAKALGIEKNDDNQYVIPGDEDLRKSSAASNNKPATVTPAVQTRLGQAFDQLATQLEVEVPPGVRKYAIDQGAANYQTSKNTQAASGVIFDLMNMKFPLRTADTPPGQQPVAQSVYNIPYDIGKVYDSKVKIPAFVFKIMGDSQALKAATNNQDRIRVITNGLANLGYPQDQAAGVAEYVVQYNFQ